MTDSKTYAPSAEFVARAHVRGLEEYQELYNRARREPEKFWAESATRELTWFRPFSKTLELDPPVAKWFTGGKLNACYNCLYRHLTTARRTKPALIWEGEPG